MDRETFKETNFYKIMHDNGIENDFGEESLKWNCYFHGKEEYTSTYEFFLDKEPNIVIKINTKDDVALTDRELMNCIKEVYDLLDPINASKDFQHITVTDDFPNGPDRIEADYDYGCISENDKVKTDLYIEVTDEEKLQKYLDQGEIGYAMILCGVRNYLKDTCEFLDKKLPEEPEKNKSVFSNLDDKKSEVKKEKASKTVTNSKDEQSI